MGKCSVILLIGFHFTFLGSSLGSKGQFGCYKANNVASCYQGSKESQNQFKKNLTISIAHAVQWMRQQRHSFPVLSSDVLQAFVLLGYYHDGSECTQNLDLERGIILNKINSNTDISGGKLAKYLIGLKASCYDNAESKSLVKSLKNKTDKFPEGAFNHFFQFSLAVIALYLHDEEIPSAYGEKIIQNVFTSKKKIDGHGNSTISDTKALSLLALSALLSQPSTTFSIRCQSLGILKKTENEIHNLLIKNNEDNLITLSLIVQAFTKTSKSIFNGTYCEDIFKKFLGKQKQDGSFGTLQETTFIVKALSGKSILDIKNNPCPMTQETLNISLYEKFLAEYRNISKDRGNKTTGSSNKKPISVTLIISNGINQTNGTNLLAHATLSVPFDSTALDVLKHGSAAHTCFQHETKSSSWGEYITKICNIKSDYGKRTYWNFRINGKSASKGASKFKIKQGDIIEFRYSTY